MTQGAWTSTRRFVLPLLIGGIAACGAEPETGAGDEAAVQRDGVRVASSPASDSDDRRLLCDRIEDDEALTPAGAETLEHPGVEAANSERRCMRLFGLDMPIEEVRGFYRSALSERGFEIVSYEEMDGIATGNLSRTFIRATASDLRASVQIDEFDPEETGLSEHRANVKLQLDAMSG